MEDVRLLPNLVIIGARKSGTTSLHGYLGQHPQVFMSKPSELHFFDNEENWEKGVEWYASHFATAGDALIRGEKTPMYSTYPHKLGIPARVKSVLPDTKLIYLMRDPIARVRSQYVSHTGHGEETLPFEQAIVQRAVYVNLSRYAEQIEQWLKYFDREQLLLLTSEQLWKHHEETMAEVFRFLGVDPDFVPEAIPLNVTKGKIIRHGTVNSLRKHSLARAIRHLPEPVKAPVRRYGDRNSTRAEEIPAVLTPEIREMLADVLRPSMARLKQYMPADFDAWGIV